MADNEVESVLRIPKLEGSQKYHAFIAHSTDDRDFTEELTTKLEDMGFKCFMYERDLPPDSSIIQGVSANIQISRRVILIVTKAFISSRWSVFEAMEALHKGYNEDRMVLIPVLYNTPTSQIPHYLRNYICLEHCEEYFWTRLTSALVEDRPPTVLIPAGNVAIGLAWSYFYGYLKLVLPGMKTRSEEFLSKRKDPTEMLGKMVIIIASSCNCPESLLQLAPDCMRLEGYVDFKAPRAEMLGKMVIIIASSCNCPESLLQLAPDCMRLEGYVDFKAPRAGKAERCYKSSIYRVKDPEKNKEYLFIAEFATPVLSLWEMEFGGLTGLTKEQKMHQRMLFSDKLEEILSHPDNRACCNKATLFEYNDETEESRRQFPKLLCQHISRELRREKDIQEQIDEMGRGYRHLVVSKSGNG